LLVYYILYAFFSPLNNWCGYANIW